LWRKALKHLSDDHVGCTTIKKIMHKLVELAETQIGDYMQRAQAGALMYDGWSKDSMHYIGVISTFMRDCTVRKDFESVCEQRTKIMLLSVAPMQSNGKRKRYEDYDEECEDDDNEGAEKRLVPSFTADSQAIHFKKILRNFKIDFDRWCVCLIGDNAAVNIKTADLCKKPHIGCKSHKLNLEVNAMLRIDNRLKTMLDSLQGLMLSLKTLKNSAVLDAYTQLRPTLFGKTRWNGKYKICEKFLKLRDILVAMHEESDNPFTAVDDHVLLASFKQQVTYYTKMLGFMNLANEALQKMGIKLVEAQLHLDNLTEQVEAVMTPFTNHLQTSGVRGYIRARRNEKTKFTNTNLSLDVRLATYTHPQHIHAQHVATKCYRNSIV
jgi:hypothetical protein